VLAGLLALRGKAPGRNRMAPARGAAFASAVRMIDRVHGDAAVMRHTALPAIAAGLTDRDVHMVGIGHRTNRCIAAAMHEALLARLQPKNAIILVAADDLHVSTG